MRTTSGRFRRVLPEVAAVAGMLAVLLTGCSSPMQSSPGAPDPAVFSTPTSTPAAAFDPNASADDALAFFDSVNASTLAADADAGGRAVLDGLAVAGFDKAAMEVTADQTTIGNAADSIQFSVRWGDSCLIGQNGSAVGGYHSTLAPVLGTGRCLIGSTRPVDW
jgi:hypothetical protein